MRGYLLGLMLSLTAISSPLLAQPPTNPNLFMEIIIDSLATTADGHALITKPTKTEFEDLMNTRVAITKLEDAQQMMAPFLKSSDETTRSVAEVFSNVYGALMQRLTDSVSLSEKLMRLDAQVSDGKTSNVNAQIAELSIEASKIGAAIDVTWKLVAQTTAVSTHVLVDLSRTQDGKLRYLRITSQERLSLRAKMRSLFGKEPEETSRAGQHAVQVAPRLLWQFLNQADWKTADMP